MVESDLGFSRRERLRNRSEFLAVYERGSRFFTPHFVLYLLKNDLEWSRLGLTVSRRIGKSVVRNRIRRRLREAFRNNRSKIRPPGDVVINARRSSREASYDEMEKQLQGVFRRWRNRHEGAVQPGSD